MHATRVQRGQGAVRLRSDCASAVDCVPSTVSGIVVELTDIARDALDELGAPNGFPLPPSGDTTIVHAVVPG